MTSTRYRYPSEEANRMAYRSAQIRMTEEEKARLLARLVRRLMDGVTADTLGREMGRGPVRLAVEEWRRQGSPRSEG